MKIRHDNWHNIKRMQFNLIYYGKFSYLDTQSMSLKEMNTLTDILVETKQLEQEQQEKARKQAEENRKNSVSRKRR